MSDPKPLAATDATAIALRDTLDFTLPAALEASEPPEARGLRRDDVRLMVSYRADDRILHTHFHALDTLLQAGDVLAMNTSGTMNAVLPATRADGTALELHLSTQLPADLWTCELRLPATTGTTPFLQAGAGETLTLPAGGSITLLVPYNRVAATGTRLWIATLTLPDSRDAYLERYGMPIRYSYVAAPWPSSYYQTAYVTEIGSAEMPSAGRAFTPELITRLVAKGVQFAPLLLHTGVASQEAYEPPYAEYYRVPATTAALVNAARTERRRVIAIGTTVVRALETVTDAMGTTHPGAGWTDLVVTPQRGIHAVTGMLTGLHEPRATHLAMLATLAGREHLRLTYAAALRAGYLWHEFGDLHLILP